MRRKYSYILQVKTQSHYIITVSLVFITLNKLPFSPFLKLIYYVMSYLDCVFLYPKAISSVLSSYAVYKKISKIIIRGLFWTQTFYSRIS